MKNVRTTVMMLVLFCFGFALFQNDAHAESGVMNTLPMMPFQVAQMDGPMDAPPPLPTSGDQGYVSSSDEASTTLKKKAKKKKKKKSKAPKKNKKKSAKKKRSKRH